MATSTIGAVQKQKMGIVECKFYSPYLPIAAAANNIKAATNITNAALTALTQPAVPRNVILTIVDTTPSITVGDVTIVGLDQDGNPATEVHDCAAGAGTYTGAIAFSRITSITMANFATLGGGGDETIAVGNGDVFGLPCGPNSRLVAVLKETLNLVDQTLGVTNATYKTYNPTGVPDAAKELSIWYIVAHDIFMG